VLSDNENHSRSISDDIKRQNAVEWQMLSLGKTVSIVL